MDTTAVKNVMPVVNKINVLPVQRSYKEVFMTNIIKAKGMESIQKLFGNITMPTLITAVTGSCWNSFHKMRKWYYCHWYRGAQTDIHSIGAVGYQNLMIYKLKKVWKGTLFKKNC